MFGKNLCRSFLLNHYFRFKLSRKSFSLHLLGWRTPRKQSKDFARYPLGPKNSLYNLPRLESLLHSFKLLLGLQRIAFLRPNLLDRILSSSTLGETLINLGFIFQVLYKIVFQMTQINFKYIWYYSIKRSSNCRIRRAGGFEGSSKWNELTPLGS